MNSKTRSNFFKCIVVLTFIGIFTQGIFPVIIGNYSEIAFREGFSKSSTDEIHVDEYIAQKIIEGGMYLLASKSKLDNTLRMIEASYLHYKNFYTSCMMESPTIENIRAEILCSFSDISQAVSSYQELVNYTHSYDYNPRTIEILSNFKYKEFYNIEMCNGTTLLGNISIYQDLYTNYLATGNIRGLYQEILDRTISLRQELNGLRIILNSTDNIPFLLEQNPKILPKFWTSNLNFGNTHLFGQYISEVFNYICDHYHSNNTPYWSILWSTP